MAIAGAPALREGYDEPGLHLLWRRGQKHIEWPSALRELGTPADHDDDFDLDVTEPRLIIDTGDSEYNDVEMLPVGSPISFPRAAWLPTVPPPSFSSEAYPVPFPLHIRSAVAGAPASGVKGQKWEVRTYGRDAGHEIELHRVLPEREVRDRHFGNTIASLFP